MKLLRDRFQTADGLVHIENSRRVITQAICGRWCAHPLVTYVEDETQVTCMNCLAAEGVYDPSAKKS